MSFTCFLQTKRDDSARMFPAFPHTTQTHTHTQRNRIFDFQTMVLARQITTALTEFIVKRTEQLTSGNAEQRGSTK